MIIINLHNLIVVVVTNLIIIKVYNLILYYMLQTKHKKDALEENYYQCKIG
jgi:hypothetical protein